MPELVPHLPFAEDQLLLDELNHRISNEFASLIAIVSRAAAASGNDEVKRALRGVAQLLHHHAQVHRALRPPDQETLVNAEGYLSELCNAISRSKLDPLKIDLVLTARPLLLESSRCWRLGMIVSELITNAARHAFAGRPGRIRVELLRAGGFAKCIVSDSGSAAAHIQPGHGLRMVEELTKALDGRFERRFEGAGTTSIVIFPLGEPRKTSSEDGQLTARSA
jgi:two-component sensor histidine kinase